LVKTQFGKNAVEPRNLQLSNRHAELDSASLVHHGILSQARDDGEIAWVTALVPYEPDETHL